MRNRNPINEYDEWEREQVRRYQKNINTAPRCDECGRTALEFDYIYSFEDIFICEDCIKTHRIDTDKYWN